MSALDRCPDSSTTGIPAEAEARTNAFDDPWVIVEQRGWSRNRNGVREFSPRKRDENSWIPQVSQRAYPEISHRIRRASRNFVRLGHWG